MASAYAFGYMLAVPVLTTLTDRIDARFILLGGSALSGAATLAFGLFAHGLWSAMPLWGLAGIGFAGAYMPGLKALTDRLPPGETSRAITFYTSSFSFGVGLSFLVAQVVADAFGWRAAFLVTGAGPLAMIATCLALPPCRPRAVAAAACSISVRCCATARRSATSSATARTASSSTACAPGSSRSGRSSVAQQRRRRAALADRRERLVTCSRCRRASSATRPRSVSAATARSRSSCSRPPRSRWRSDCRPMPRRICCSRSSSSTPSPSTATPARSRPA